MNDKILYETYNFSVVTMSNDFISPYDALHDLASSIYNIVNQCIAFFFKALLLASMLYTGPLGYP